MISWVRQSVFLKFLCVGGASTLAQFLVLIMLVEWLRTPAIAASALSYLFGAACNYLLNYYVTFRASEQHVSALPKFLLVVLVGLSANTMFFSFFLSILDIYLVAQVLATVLTLILNFLLHKLWIYRTSVDVDKGAVE